jgi:toxin ParE1/3/4
LPEAERDFDNQLDYLLRHDSRARIDAGDAILAAVDRLVDHPRFGRPGRAHGTRELVVTRTPYVIIYPVDPSEVVILRVLHGAQRWPPR